MTDAFAHPRVAAYFPQLPGFVDELRMRFPELSVVGLASHNELLEYADSVEICVTNGVGFGAGVAEALPNLRWIQSVLSGTDQFAEVISARPDVLVTSAKGIHGSQMSEMALVHMLTLSRTVGALIHQQQAHVWRRLPQRVLDGKSVGIVGLGASGARLAAVCKALGMTVFGVNQSGRPVADVDHLVPMAELVTVAEAVDYLVLLVPHSDQTHGLIGQRILSAMKPTAVLVNLARGGVVVEDDLVAALHAGEIAGAGLDVAAVEPLPESSPLWDMDNVFITPHLAGESDRYLDTLIAEVVEPNLRAYLGDAPLGSYINVVSTGSHVYQGDPA